jgi:hypothetical protein
MWLTKDGTGWEKNHSFWWKKLFMILSRAMNQTKHTKRSKKQFSSLEGV